jgi:hypothetical protein
MTNEDTKELEQNVAYLEEDSNRDSDVCVLVMMRMTMIKMTMVY